MGLQKLMSEQKKASIDKEHQAVGAVSSGTYTTYLRSVHPKCLILLFLVTQVLKIAFNTLMTLSLGSWADSTLVGQHDHYMQQYGTYLFFNAISSTTANILLTIMMVSASMYEWHDALFHQNLTFCSHILGNFTIQCLKMFSRQK